MHGTETLVDLVLTEMSRQFGPMGARTLHRGLADKGFGVSESTVSRILTELDDRGLTVVVGKKGRELTVAGRELADAIRVGAQRDAQLTEAFDIRHVDDLLDLLTARRALERETVTSAARRASDEEIERLLIMTTDGSDVESPALWHERVDFHTFLGGITHNKLLEALTDVVFDPRLRVLERLIVMIRAHAGTLGHSQDEHRAIAEAIAARDDARAEDLMVQHIDRMITEIVDFAASTSTTVLEQLVQHHQAAPSVPVRGPRTPLPS